MERARPVEVIAIIIPIILGGLAILRDMSTIGVILIGLGLGALAWELTTRVFHPEYARREIILASSWATVLVLCLSSQAWLQWAPKADSTPTAIKQSQVVNANPAVQNNSTNTNTTNITVDAHILPAPDRGNDQPKLFAEIRDYMMIGGEVFVHAKIINNGGPSIAHDYVLKVSTPSRPEVRLFPENLARRPKFGPDAERDLERFKVDLSVPLDVQSTDLIPHNRMIEGWLRFAGVGPQDLQILNENGGTVQLEVLDSYNVPIYADHPIPNHFCDQGRCEFCADHFYAPALPPPH